MEWPELFLARLCLFCLRRDSDTLSRASVCVFIGWGWELECFSCGNIGQQYWGFLGRRKRGLGMAGGCAPYRSATKGPPLGLHQFVPFIAFSTHCSLIIIINSYQTKFTSFCLFPPPGRVVLLCSRPVSTVEGGTAEGFPVSCSVQRSCLLSPLLPTEMGFARIRAFLFSPFSVCD